MRKLMHLLKSTMEVPPVWGIFHFVAIALTALVTLCLCLFFRDSDNKTYRTVLLVIWIIMVLMEAVKQFEESYSFLADGKILWKYSWKTFPLQLCDSPFYFLLPAAFLKDGKVRDAVSSFMCSYILLGGLATYLFPSTTFCSNVYLNVHTMTHHGLQIASCIYIGVHNRHRLSLISFARGILVFVSVVAVATIFNVVMHAIHPEQEINMCYISPYFRKTIPMTAFNDAFQKMHWAAVIAFYIGALTLIAFVLYHIYRLFTYLADRRKTARAQAA